MTVLSNGTKVDVVVMNAYPDGCLLAADLASVVLPALSEIPADVVNSAKAVASGALEGGEARAAASAAAERLKAVLNDDEASARMFRGMAKALAGLADRDRFERIAGQLFATLTVQHGGRLVELANRAAVQSVVGTDLKLALELLYVALKENFTSFFSGGGDTIAESSSAPARKG
jgi:hypothetical protein